jgi:signal transduction histidine kinase
MATAPTRTRTAPQHPRGLRLTGALARALDLGVVVVDSGLVVREFNPAAERIVKMVAGQLLSDRRTALPSPLPQLVESTLRTGRPVKDRIVPLGDACQPPATHVRVSTLPWSITGDEGGSGALLLLQDLGAAREMEDKIERLERLASVGTLSAGVAHEIKNALVAIKTFSQILLEREPELESARLVSKEVSRIDALISQLLRFAGPARPAFGPVHVHEVIRNTLRLVQHPLKTRQIEERVFLEATDDRVMGDFKQLEQALLNLALNALEAMGTGGQLVVRTEVVIATEHISKFEPKVRDEQIQIEVADTGPGIPAEVAGKLFSPFVTTKPEGTGLGLMITRRIIQEHHGSISVVAGAASGAVFRILLPLSRRRN